MALDSEGAKVVDNVKGRVLDKVIFDTCHEN